MLSTLLDVDPTSPQVVALVTRLHGYKVRGRWGNTQENAFVLLSLDRYFQVFEADEPYFVARAWLGKDFAGQHEFEGRNTDYHHISIPMTHLDKKKNLVLSKEGKGRLYYRLGLRYAPAKLELEPSDHGQGLSAAADAEKRVRWTIVRGLGRRGSMLFLLLGAGSACAKPR